MKMKIAIASGKGGTGKTTVAANLAYVASRQGRGVTFLDCDVEEPNGHIFLNPRITERRPVGSLIPSVDTEKCTLCRKCGEICQYSAIVPMTKTVLVYPELCHSCGGCWLVCPAKAITEVIQEKGNIEIGVSGSIQFIQGLLNIGEAMSPPVIKAVKASAPETEIAIIDAPPGTSCPVIESIRGSNFVVLVTESTPFGLHDLKLAVEMVRALQLPFGVVINRAGLGDQEVILYCERHHVPVLAEIPDDRRIAERYSRGKLICEALPEYTALFEGLFEKVEAKVKIHARQRCAD